MWTMRAIWSSSRALQSRASPKSPATFLKLPSRTVRYPRKKLRRSQSFLTTFFTLYPTATEQELSYYVSGGALPVIGNDSYVFAGLVNPVFTKNGDAVTANVAVQYLDQRTGMTQVSQFTLHLRQVEGNWKISC